MGLYRNEYVKENDKRNKYRNKWQWMWLLTQKQEFEVKKNRFPTLEPITSLGHCWRLGFDCGHQPQLLGTSPWNFFPLPPLSVRTRTWIIWDINCTAVENCVNPGKPKGFSAYCWPSSQKPAFVLSYGYDCLRPTEARSLSWMFKGQSPTHFPAGRSCQDLQAVPWVPLTHFWLQPAPLSVPTRLCGLTGLSFMLLTNCIYVFILSPGHHKLLFPNPIFILGAHEMILF